jgi:hypothetical protein
MKEKKTQKAIEMHTMTLEGLLDKFLAKRQLVRVVRPKTNLITPYDEENPVTLSKEDLQCLKQPTPIKPQQHKQQQSNKKGKGKRKIDTLSTQEASQESVMSPPSTQMSSPASIPPSTPVKTREDRVTKAKTPLVKTPSGTFAHKDRSQDIDKDSPRMQKEEEPRGRTPMRREFRSRSRDREPSRKPSTDSHRISSKDTSLEPPHKVWRQSSEEYDHQAYREWRGTGGTQPHFQEEYPERDHRGYHVEFQDQVRGGGDRGMGRGFHRGDGRGRGRGFEGRGFEGRGRGF